MPYSCARYAAPLLLMVLGSGPGWAQAVISARSGMIHYVEGEVAIDGNNIRPKFAEFPDLKNGQVLTTAEGRAEVLLTPGVFLRVAESSSVRMLSNALADTRVEVVSGTVLIEAGELLPDNAVTFEVQEKRIAIPKRGLYRIDAANARLAVFDGQALVTSGATRLRAKKGQDVTFAGETASTSKFDVKATDPFYRWSARRAGYIAAANVTAARVASNSDYRSGFSGRGASAWNWNPWFGMYTFVPPTGIYLSPFGPSFYSPGMIGGVYLSTRPIYGFRGMRNSPAQGGMMNSPAMSAPPSFGGPPSMGGPRGGGGFGGGGMGSGRAAQLGGPRGR